MAIRILDVREQGFLLAAGPSPTHPSITRGACSVGPGAVGIPGTPLCLFLAHLTGGRREMDAVSGSTRADANSLCLF